MTLHSIRSYPPLLTPPYPYLQLLYTGPPTHLNLNLHLRLNLTLTLNPHHQTYSHPSSPNAYLACALGLSHNYLFLILQRHSLQLHVNNTTIALHTHPLSQYNSSPPPPFFSQIHRVRGRQANPTTAGVRGVLTRPRNRPQRSKAREHSLRRESGRS